MILNNESLRDTNTDTDLRAMGYQEPELSFLQKATVEYHRSMLPRRCCVSNQLLWGKTAVRARRLFYGLAGESPMFEDRWYDCNEYLMLKLKG